MLIKGMKNIPFRCHVQVCVNDRKGERPSCADKGSVEIRKKLKAKVKALGWDKQGIRVSQTLCLGLCDSGPNVLLYPQNIHYPEVRGEAEDIQNILDQIAQYLR